MKSVKFCMLIAILLFRVPVSYCFYQDNGMDPEPVIQEMVSERQAIEERFISYKNQKALEKEKIRKRLSQAKARLEQIQAVQGAKSIKPKTNSSKREKSEKRAQRQLFKQFYFILLIAAMFGCVYWIYKIKKRN